MARIGSRRQLELAELRLVAGGVALREQARLRRPVVAPDAALEAAELRVDAVDLGIVPRGDLHKAGDAERVQLLDQLRAEALDLRQVVVGQVDRNRRGRRGNRFADAGEAL